MKKIIQQLSVLLLFSFVTLVLKAQDNSSLQFTNANNNFIQWNDTNALITSHANFTIEMWIKGGTSTHGKMIYCEGINSNRNMFRLYASGGKVVIRPNGTSTDQIVSTGLNVFSDTASWHHIAVVGKTPGGLGTETTLELFIDGVSNTSGTYTYTTAVNYTRTAVGNLTRTSSQTTAYAFDGEIDELRTWSRALNQSELTINKCSLGNKSNLVRHVRFNEGSGSTVYDEVASSSVAIQGKSPIWTTNSKCSKKLVAYYPFNGNANDESANNNNGIVHGAELTTNRYGNANSAYMFNGSNQYIQIPDNNVFSISSASKMSISVWIRVDKLDFTSAEGGSDRYVHWMGKGTNGQQEWALRMYNLTSGRPNRTSFYAFNLDGTLGAGSYVEETVNTEEWIHYVVLYDYANDKIKLYKNGILKDTDQFSDYNIVPGNGTAPVRIGTRDFNSYFKGAIDDIRFYNGILTPEEIMNLHDESGTLSNNKVKLQNIEFKIYPNSTSGVLNIYNNKKTDWSFKIVDIFGRLVKHGKATTKINIEDLPRGMYFFIIKSQDSNNYIFNKKVIKL